MGHISGRKRPRPPRKQPLGEFEVSPYPGKPTRPRPPKRPPKKGK